MLKEHCKRFENVVSVQQPLGLAYLAAVLEECGHELQLIDAAVSRLDNNQILAMVKNFHPNIIGITALTPVYQIALSLANNLKEGLGLPIVIGGPHVTAIPQQTMENKCFDFAVLGEGERTFPELVEALEKDQEMSKVRGIAYRQGEKVVATGPQPPIDNLDVIPFPARHLLPPLAEYQPSPAAYKRLPQATMMTSRGCPYHCAFCDHSVFGNRFRARTARNVVDEIELLASKYGVNEIRFWDDMFNMDPIRVISICDEMISRGLDMPWTCLARADHMNAEILDAMASAGCWQIDYGIESGNQAILNGIMKGQTLDLVEKVVKMTRKAGVGVRGFFMLALPGETESTMRDTLRFAKKLNLTSAVFHLTTPFPGTTLFNLARNSGELREDVSYDAYMLGFSDDVPYVPKALNAQLIKDFQQTAYGEFYLRPSFLMKRILEIRSLGDIQRYAQAFFTVNNLDQ